MLLKYTPITVVQPQFQYLICKWGKSNANVSAIDIHTCIHVHHDRIDM